jgi:hypothetical protein
MTIRVHIDCLVIEGMELRRREIESLRLAATDELSRLLRHHGAYGLIGEGAVPHLMGGRVRLSATSRPTDVGRQIAAAVHAGIAPGAPEKRHSPESRPGGTP